MFFSSFKSSVLDLEKCILEAGYTPAEVSVNITRTKGDYLVYVMNSDEIIGYFKLTMEDVKNE